MSGPIEIEDGGAALEGDVLRRYVDSRVRDLVGEEVSREEEKRFKQLQRFIAIVGLIGLGTFGTLSNYLIEKAVDSRLESRTGRISESLDFLRFATIVTKLELGTSFTPYDRDAVMNFLRRASKNDDVRLSSEFSGALFQVTRAFASANQAASIDEIFTLFEREIVASNELVEALLHHYGQALVARPVIPDNDEVRATFEKLEGLAMSSNVPELALYYRILADYEEGPQNTDQLIELFAQARNLNEADLSRFFFELLTRTKSENWVMEDSVEGKRFQEISRRFLRDLGPSLAQQLGLEEDTFGVAATDGIESSEMARLMGQLLSSRVSAAQSQQAQTDASY
jgi:hypothetical protein